MKRLNFLASMVMATIALGVSLWAVHDANGQILRKKAVPVVVVQTEVLPQPAAQVEPTAKKTGAVFNAVVRMKVRQEYRKQGLGLIESIRKANAVASDEAINGLIADAEAISGVKIVGTAIGDGTFMDKLIDFFNSPAGKMLLDALLKLLFGLI